MDEPVGRITGWPLKLRIIFSSIGIFVGVSVFIVFSTHYKNYNTGLWALVSGLAAAIALGVTIAYHKRAWDSNPMCLKSFMLLGCFIQLAGVCGLVAYLVLGITKQDGLVIYGTDYYLTCVWCFMTWKWGLGILLYSRTFLRSYTERGRLLNDDAEIAKKAYNIR